ncbi:MAG TPA: YceI family protein [Terriglobales bacterium]|nr:YceI family protein [Terriglobales bacterium]
MSLCSTPRALLLAALLSIAANSLWSAPRAIDTERSSITVRVFKSGLFSAFADNHEISGAIASGSVDEAARRVELTIHAGALKVVDLNLDAGKREEVQKRMAGAEVLDAEHYPEIRFRSLSVEPRGSGADKQEWLVKGELMLRGQTRPMALHVIETKGRYFVTTSLKQRDFGIQPISIAGGTVKVKDEITIEFQVALMPETSKPAEQ